MPITPEFAAVVERLNQELNSSEQRATKGLNLLRKLLSRFPSNATLIQYFAYFNTILLFIETSRKQIQNAVDIVAPADIPIEIIQETGERLGTLLGRVLEIKLRVGQLVNRLEE